MSTTTMSMDSALALSIWNAMAADPIDWAYIHALRAARARVAGEEANREALRDIDIKSWWRTHKGWFENEEASIATADLILLVRSHSVPKAGNS